jgi:hypothetical protein
MATISVRHIMEAGIVSFLQAQSELAGVNIYAGDSTELAVHPKVVVTCEGARTPALMPDGLGNYDCTLRIVISDNANDVTLATHRAHEAAVLGALSDESGIKAAFAAADPVEAFIYMVNQGEPQQGIDPEGNYWNSVTTVLIRCCVNPQP